MQGGCSPYFALKLFDMRVAINGMGRIGRLLFRRLATHPDVQIVAVNDVMDTANLVYLLKYDSVYGTYSYSLVLNETLQTEAGEIKCLRQNSRN